MAIARLEEGCTYQQLLTDHLLPNEPCVFPSSLIGSWPCFESFARSGEEAKIDLDRLLALQQGSSPLSSFVSVHRPSTDEELADGCPPSVCEERSLEEVFELWKRGEGHGLYVKDWHLAHQVQQAGGDRFYEDTWGGMTRDDWLNEFYQSHNDEDFRFVYLGTSGTTTLLHRDVYSSNSISSNVFGPGKRWHLFPPSVVQHLHRNPEDLRSELIQDVRAVDETRYPRWSRAKERCVVVDQAVGETIFVPSGWYHQVENLASPSQPFDLVLSINHNWANSTTLLRMFDTLCRDIDACARSIEDIKILLRERRPAGEWEGEWVQEVQDLVKRDAGWSWKEFWSFVLSGVQNSRRAAFTDWQPPRSFIIEQVDLAMSRMQERWELQWLAEVRETMDKVARELRAASADGT